MRSTRRSRGRRRAHTRALPLLIADPEFAGEECLHAVMTRERYDVVCARTGACELPRQEGAAASLHRHTLRPIWHRGDTPVETPSVTVGKLTLLPHGTLDLLHQRIVTDPFGGT